MKRMIRKLRRNRHLQQRQNSETPMFERLEPRLLLNADVEGLLADTQPVDPLDTTNPTDAIEVDLNNEGDETASANASTFIPQSVPYTQNFDAGLPTDIQGWEYYSDNEGRIQVVSGRLRMDDSVSGSASSLNEAILHLDLTGASNVTLTLDHYNLGDEADAPPLSFTGHYKGDGIALSVDGINWVRITNLDASFTNQSYALDAIIAQAQIDAGITDLSDVRIKFQQYDNYPAPTDGREFDNIQVTASAAQSIPYTQNFDAGLPTSAQGWEYYSDNDGRIQVVSGRLRMDDTVADSTSSLNEAILHVNLTGKTNVTLTLDHIKLSDEVNNLPTSFAGHYKADGIALSVDGLNWITITNLDASFTAQSFALDAIIELAKTAAGTTDVSDVRIKFQQYDNFPATSDGREFDNIQVTSTTTTPEIDVTGNSQVIIDGDTTPSTSDHTDFGSVAPGGSIIRTFTIRNTGGSALNLTGSPKVQIIGSSNFTVITQPISPVAAGGGTTVFQIRFAPTSTGLKTATILIYNNDSDENPYDFVIQGTGASVPEIEVLGNGQEIVDGDTTPTTTDHTYFGAVTPGGTIIRTFTIRNTGGSTLYLTGSPRVQLSGSSDFTVNIQPASSVAPSGGTTTFQIRFNPGSSGVKTATVLIYNNDSNENPYDFVIQGTGFDVPEIDVLGNGQVITDGDTTPSTSDHTDFGNVTTGGSLVRTFTIRNTGTDVLTLYGSPRVQLSGSSDFVVVLQPSSTVAAYGGTTTFQIQFSPSSVGLKTATLQIANTDPNEDPYNFVIQGTGIAAGIIPQAVPYSQDFESGQPSGAQGWEYYSDNEGRIQVVGGRMRMDDTGANSILSLNEAILHVNLTGETNVTLSLDHWSISDETHTMPVSFTGHYKADGIAVSIDGTNWIKVSDLTGTSHISVDLDLVALFGGSADLSDVRIKFQQYDNNMAPDDGREFDNISVTTGLAVQSVPYSQDFSSGLPNVSQGWEYYSDNEGRIQVVGGRMRMDDTGANSILSLNEAILHVNLTGETNVTLSLDHWSISDETHTMPVSFTGHYKADGIAVSIDGTNWIKVSDLTGTSHISVDLDLVALFGGSADLSDVRIKFQQYDNNMVPDDGREFDNITLTTGLAVQSVPYSQDFSSGLPNASQGWEYYSDNEGRIQVVGGRMRMDDTGANSILSLNEAILHVNLTGETNVTLSLDHWSISDETHTMPVSFTGHYKADGIAVSIDGTNWIKVSDLTGTSHISLNLDLVALFGGSADLSDVRIKFQQYDNNMAPDDGREFDNIQILSL